MTEKEKRDIIWASGHFLGEYFPEDFDTWTDDKLEQFCEDHVWEPLEGSDGKWIVEEIHNLAWSVREYINVQKNKEEAEARKKEMDHIMSLYKRMKKMELSGFDKIDYLERRMLAEREEE